MKVAVKVEKQEEGERAAREVVVVEKQIEKMEKKPVAWKSCSWRVWGGERMAK